MKNALIVIDVQNDYFAGGAWPQFQAAETAARIADCVRAADAAGDWVVAVRHVNAADAPMLAAGSAGVAFYPEIAPLLAGRATVDKHAADAFWQTDLAQVLAAAGVSDIYLCGMMTQNCITHTALSPDAAAWRVHIIADACTAPDARIHAVAARALSARLDVVSAVGFQAALGVV